jgi:DtxR family transcriptional regulator, Mn-dependent transcriptional regulator
MNTIIEENYLKIIYNLSLANGEVSMNELAKSLGLKMPTVNSMMKKLALKKLLTYESYKPVKITEKGKKEAVLIIRKHRLTEMFLVEKMGFSWEEVHTIAEQIEHIQSPDFFEKMDALLDYPKFDPHGSPIPDKQGKIEQNVHHKLSECKKGEIVKLVGVVNSSNEFLKFLNSKKIKLGEGFKILNVELFDNSVTLSYGKTKATFSQKVCDSLLIKKLST